MLNKKRPLFALAALVGAILLTACESVTQEVVVADAVKETVQETAVENETAVEEMTVVEEKGVTSRGAGDTANLIYWQAPSLVNPYLAGGAKGVTVVGSARVFVALS